MYFIINEHFQYEDFYPFSFDVSIADLKIINRSLIERYFDLIRLLNPEKVFYLLKSFNLPPEFSSLQAEAKERIQVISFKELSKTHLGKSSDTKTVIVNIGTIIPQEETQKCIKTIQALETDFTTQGVGIFRDRSAALTFLTHKPKDVADLQTRSPFHQLLIRYPWQLLQATSNELKGLEEKIEGKVESNVHIEGPVVLCPGALIRSGAYIQGPVYIDRDAVVGPNCFIRPSTYIGPNVHIGNAVEIKNSSIGANSNVGHLSYIGDSIIGERCNFGAGTKVANLKFRGTVKVTIGNKRIDSKIRKMGVMVGNDVKTGINVSLMPGLKLGPNSWVGAHVLLTEDLPPQKFVTIKSPNSNLEWRDKH